MDREPQIQAASPAGVGSVPGEDAPVAAGTGGVILFDGVCNLCNSSVNFVIDRDPAGYFRFAALQSEPGALLLRRHGLDEAFLDGVVLIEAGRCYSKSGAVLRVARRLGWFWPLMALFLVIPPVIRDWVYGIVAKRRYRWFGQRESCRMPTPELESRFLT